MNLFELFILNKYFYIKSFIFSRYHQSDLQRREEFGIFDHDPITNDRIFTVNGSYEFIRSDGKRQIVEYTAGKDGFKPKVTVE